MVERLTAAEAATQIVGLINSRPATPWPHEIEAIIARIAPMVPACDVDPAGPCCRLLRPRRNSTGMQSVVGPTARRDRTTTRNISETRILRQSEWPVTPLSWTRPPRHGAIWSALPASLRTRRGMTSTPSLVPADQ